MFLEISIKEDFAIKIKVIDENIIKMFKNEDITLADIYEELDNKNCEIKELKERIYLLEHPDNDLSDYYLELRKTGEL